MNATMYRKSFTLKNTDGARWKIEHKTINVFFSFFFLLVLPDECRQFSSWNFSSAWFLALSGQAKGIGINIVFMAFHRNENWIRCGKQSYRWSSLLSGYKYRGYFRPIELYRLEWTFSTILYDIAFSPLVISNMIASCLLSFLSSMRNDFSISFTDPFNFALKAIKSGRSRIDSLTFFRFSPNFHSDCLFRRRTSYYYLLVDWNCHV